MCRKFKIACLHTILQLFIYCSYLFERPNAFLFGPNYGIFLE